MYEAGRFPTNIDARARFLGVDPKQIESGRVPWEARTGDLIGDVIALREARARIDQELGGLTDSFADPIDPARYFEVRKAIEAAYARITQKLTVWTPEFLVVSDFLTQEEPVEAHRPDFHGPLHIDIGPGKLALFGEPATENGYTDAFLHVYGANRHNDAYVLQVGDRNGASQVLLPRAGMSFEQVPYIDLGVLQPDHLDKLHLLLNVWGNVVRDANADLTEASQVPGAGIEPALSII